MFKVVITLDCQGVTDKGYGCNNSIYYQPRILDNVIGGEYVALARRYAATQGWSSLEISAYGNLTAGPSELLDFCPEHKAVGK